MARYAPEVEYVQGKHQNTADALPRAPTSTPTPKDLKWIEVIEEYSKTIVATLRATNSPRRGRHLQASEGILSEWLATCHVIPSSLQPDMLNAIHDGHLGITKCQGRASYSVWWPLIAEQIEAMVNRCHTCAKLRPETREPLLALSFPSKPWNRLASDLFELDKKSYIIVVVE